MRSRLLVAGMVAVLLLPGCFGAREDSPQADASTPTPTPTSGPGGVGPSTPATAGPDAGASTPPQPTRLMALTERSPVSADHRVGEFSVARDPLDPLHLALVGYDLDSSQGASYCTVFTSRDGGVHWTMTELVPGDVGAWAGDPWIAIGPDGRVSVTCLTTSIANGASTYFYSGDGATWAPPTVVPGVTDKEAVYAGPDGVLVCGSTGGAPDGGNSLAVQRTVDQGRTFLAPTYFADLSNCNGFAAGPRGALVMTWLAVAGETRRVGTLTSRDGGATWDAPTLVATHPYPNDFANPEYYASAPDAYTRPTGNWPNVAVSPRSGAVLFATDRDDVETGQSGIHLRVSQDLGATYSLLALPPIPTALADVVLSRPTVAFDAAGTLGLQVMANGGMAYSEREFWFLASTDDGATWLPPLLIASTDAQHSRLDPRAHAPNTNAPPNQAAYVLSHPAYADTTFPESALLLANSQQLEYGGDYGALAASPLGFVALWQDSAEGGELRTYSRIVGLA